MDYCALSETCNPGDPDPECVPDCIEGHGYLEGECLDAQLGLTVCMAGLSCEDLALYFEHLPGFPGAPCEEQGNALCEPGCSGSSETQGSSCSVEWKCEGLPFHTIECDAEQCACAIEGEQVGSCPSDPAVCDLDLVATDACCGWQLSEI